MLCPLPSPETRPPKRLDQGREAIRPKRYACSVDRAEAIAIQPQKFWLGITIRHNYTDDEVAKILQEICAVQKPSISLGRVDLFEKFNYRLKHDGIQL